MNQAIFKVIVAASALISTASAEVEIASLDANDLEMIARDSPYTMKRIKSGEQLSVNDIKTMTQLGISDDKIIGTIKTTNSVYHLSSSDEEDLKDHGVSKRVIETMKKTPY